MVSCLILLVRKFPLICKKPFKSAYPITSWEIDGETEETVSDFILGSSKITADSDWAAEVNWTDWAKV